MTINASGQIVFGFSHIECMTLGADEVTGGTSGFFMFYSLVALTQNCHMVPS